MWSDPILEGRKLVTVCPICDVRPFFTASPVTDEVFVSAVDKNVHLILEKVGDLLLKAEHPIT